MWQRFRRFIRSSITIIAVGAVLIGICVWLFGPLIAVADYRPFEDPTVRAVTIGGLVLLVIIVALVILLRRRAREARLTEEIAKSDRPEDLADAAVRAELGEVGQRMKDALALLRRSRLGRNLYTLPWYIIIGPPGAGKTTAIVNSGLQFPLADQMGKTSIRGVGGTRNCDWWFTNDAVLIDTAGRYTTQDSDATADARAWSGFLDILKKNRPRQPINGAIVAISLSDLSLLDDAARRAHALAIRKRLAELRAKLGVRFPAYVLFTKADLVAGFQEFFETLGKDGREQVWGFTLPLERKGDATSPVQAFDSEFDALLQALNNQALERMQQETDPQRRSLVQGFPQQLASLREVARDFLTDIFQESRFEERQLLRGVYLASGTQEGTPIDRLMMGMARTFGIGRQAIGSGQGQGRSYFLTRLLDQVIFREAGIVSADDRVERRYRWALRGGFAVAALVFLGLAAAWTVSFVGNRTLVAEARAKLVNYQTLVAAIPVNPVKDTDLPSVLPALAILRDMPGNPAQGDAEPPASLTWGLYQGDSIGTEAAQTYRGALNQLLLPRLLLRLEEQMSSNLNNSEFLFEALKVYLMLGLEAPDIDRDFVTQFLKLDWTVAYPGDVNAKLRDDLAAHLDRMLAQPMQKIALNGPLVDLIQGILAEVQISQRIYNGIVQSRAARALPDWRLIDAGGPATARTLTRPSGTNLAEGVPGIYTYRGFHEVFLPAALDVAARITRESWVLGPRGATQTTPENLALIARDVINVYYSDYIGHWERILGDIDVQPMPNMAAAIEIANLLSGPASPIVNIMKSVADETRLAEDRKQVNTDTLKQGTTEIVTNELIEGQSARVQDLLLLLRQAAPSVTGQDNVQQKPGQVVQDHFQKLQDYVKEEPGKPSQLSLTLQTMNEVYQEMNRLAVGGGGLLPAPGTPAGGATDRLTEATGRLDPPMKRWATQVATGAAEVVTGGIRSQINAVWQSQVLPTCRVAVTDRYPFSKRSQSDIGVQDFAKLFAPDGLIDAFFKQQLLNHVDTGSNPWKWKRQAGKDLGISDAVLQNFQLAAQIRDAFFLAAGPPQVSFDLTPESLDPTAQKVILELDGQVLEFANGPPDTVPMQWPKGGRNRVAFVPELPGVENQIARQGPWAMFRLLDAAVKQRSQVGDQIRLVFPVGGRVATFNLRAGSAFNPFSLPALEQFRCLSAL